MQRIALVFAFQAAMLLAQGGSATIQGSVSEANGKKAIAGAFVTAVRSGLPPASSTVATAADGTYKLSGLAAGSYSLCVQVPGGGYLDPCQWSGQPVKLTLTAGQQSSGNALKISAGSTLQVRMDDPQNLLGKKTADGRDPHLMVGVWLVTGMFYPLHIDSKDKSGANFQVTVPLDTPLKLHVSSPDLKIADSNGAAIASTGDQQPFQHGSSDANPKSFKYSVTGVQPGH